jgi:5-methylcytosine-specific restriction endonuclease McrA
MRKTVHAKYGGRCAYCGQEITLKQMHVDHLKPIWRGNPTVNPKYRGADTIDNMMPACRACNLWKSVHPLEQFRAEMTAQVERLRLRSANYRMAERYGLVEATGKPVIFWFER